MESESLAAPTQRLRTLRSPTPALRPRAIRHRIEWRPRARATRASNACDEGRKTAVRAPLVRSARTLARARETPRAPHALRESVFAPPSRSRELRPTSRSRDYVAPSARDALFQSL